MKTGSVPSLLNDIVTDLGEPTSLWQVALIILCVGLAHWRARVTWLAWQPRIANNRSSEAWSAVQSDALARLLFPVFALTGVALCKLLFGIWFKTQILNLALVLLVALALVRIIVYSVSRLSRSKGLLAFERLLVVGVWLGVVLYVSGHWIEVVELLEFTKLTVGKQTISLWMLLTGIFWTVLTVFASIWLGGFIEARLIGNEGIDASLSAMLGRLVRALLLVAGLLIGLTLVGLDLTVLSVFGGALGVGIGLGLQRIASNYISGFIVLLERMIRIGDVVKVDQFSGQVKAISTRFTVLRSGEGIDQIVPNELLTAQAVQNFTTSGVATVKMPLHLAHSADLTMATGIVLDAIIGVDRVLEQPAPAVFFRGWTPDGLHLELIFSVSDPNKGHDRVRSDVLAKIWERWRRAGIAVAPLQHHLRPPESQIATPGADRNNPTGPPVSGMPANR